VQSPEASLAALVARTAKLELAWLFWQNPQLESYAGVMAELEQAVAGEHFDRRIGSAERSRPTALGSQTRKSSSSGSAAQLAADAFRQMPKTAEWAISWVLKADEEAHDKLHNRLMRIADREAERKPYWPASVNRRQRIGRPKPSDDFATELCELALLELHSPSDYQTNAQRADWFGLSWERWRKIMQRPYGALQTQAFMWFGDGCSHIVKQLKKGQRVDTA